MPFKKNLSRALTIALSILLTACTNLTGEEVARLAINQPSSKNNLIMKETSLTLKKGEKIIFWSEIDMEYEGDAELRFRVQVLKDGAEFGSMEIDPTKKNISLAEVKTTWQDKTSWRFTGRNTSAEMEADGNYTFKAILVTSDNPTLKVSKAELIIKK